ncbi:hypothetical protein [Rhizobium subbaraonis]|uniref:hypothetical protein n=1 Tax=Rhizobium subbaraonis TaxID=908946 RepID=UPI001596E2F2|nr:hypothetical protein [Rhizobium subbaraonis]
MKGINRTPQCGDLLDHSFALQPGKLRTDLVDIAWPDAFQRQQFLVGHPRKLTDMLIAMTKQDDSEAEAPPRKSQIVGTGFQHASMVSPICPSAMLQKKEIAATFGGTANFE